ncbi:MAG TPA: right-handed parallel beta-helix repeat-containing protein [Gaiellaceae bacterium]|nr:right-handed parallel beta-helix repeat-containing protein [Gaiellaceae bacterium]
MSYTLRGRLESRLAAAGLPFLVACIVAVAVHRWWPVELVGAMVAAGLVLDLVYDRCLPYQPGWAAVPLGLLELGATMGLVRLLDIAAPLRPALWFFAGSWLVAQLLAHAGFPLLRLTYADDGGELGPPGTATLLAAPTALLLVLGTAAATLPPTVVLEAGVHSGPLVLDHSQKLVGEPGAVVRGGIVITADDVTVRDLAVVGGEYGVEVQGAESVVLQDISISGASMDGIHARRSSLTIRHCVVRMVGEHTQGIDISFAFDLAPSQVTDCTVIGGREGIVSHMAHVDFRENYVRETTFRGIVVTEMSMGKVSDNALEDAVGVGIYCGDYSHCDITRNSVRAIRPDLSSDDRLSHGLGILSQFHAQARISDNGVVDSPGGVRTSSGGTIERD